MRFVWCFMLLSGSLFSQTFMRPGITAGPNFNWPYKLSTSNGSFGVARAEFQAGLTNSLQVGPHFFSKISVLYSRQAFAVRNRSNPDSSLDVRFRLHNIEIPLVAGFSGDMGSLRHREFIGLSWVNPLKWSATEFVNEEEKTPASTDSPAAMGILSSGYPLLLAGFEVGSVFKNDGAVFFGATFRYGTGDVFNTHFEGHPIAYRGTGLSIDITWYFPRYSYWFKREFTF